MKKLNTPAAMKKGRNLRKNWRIVETVNTFQVDFPDYNHSKISTGGSYVKGGYAGRIHLP
jgi:hypothetical protein